jgi:subtilisin family serine protease
LRVRFSSQSAPLCIEVEQPGRGVSGLQTSRTPFGAGTRLEHPDVYPGACGSRFKVAACWQKKTTISAEEQRACVGQGRLVMKNLQSPRGCTRASYAVLTAFFPKLATLCVVAAVASSAIADPKQSQHYLGGQVAKPALVPAGVGGDRLVPVVVEMSTPPVAAVLATTADHTIPDAQRSDIAAQIAVEHSTIEPIVSAHGGQVLARFHSAINGLKALVHQSDIEYLKSMPGVIAVRRVREYHLNNAESVPFIAAPQVWQGTPAFRGEGIKIAIIDTGVDYTHANFGGPGTVDAFNAAAATSTQPADPTLFGPKAPKVKGGTDLVGDDYDASSNDPNKTTPHPDPNPLDCNGHGSHTAGTATGFGVTNDHKTFQGPYNSAAYSTGFLIGPGVAPKADLYAVRVFGCTGSTNVVVDAIDWAIANKMNVISMSLGADYGTDEDADAVASTNATRAGIIVVAAAGNAGPAPYIGSSPAVSSESIAAAAIDSHASFPGAQVTLNDGTIEALDSNGVALPGPLDVVVLRNPSGSVSLGCNESEYVDSLVAGKLVVTARGTCARVLRAQLGQKHGAAAVAMINTSAGYPPFEGPIAGVTIPFLGILTADGTKLATATAASFAANTIPNPTFRTAASFSSGGPAFASSVLKPNVAAPGVSIFSTGSGTGFNGVFESGTSMATPHVAGVAALTRQAHPHWSEKELSAAVVQTADPTQLTDYTAAIEGAGLVQATGAAATQAVVFANTEGGEHAISFGFEEFLQNFREERDIVVRNLGDDPIVFNVTSTPTSEVPHTLRVSNRVFIEPHGQREIDVTLSVPASTVGSTHDVNGNDLFEDVAGYLTFAPANPHMNGGVTLNVPYYLVPRVRSDVFALLAGRLSATRPTSEVLLANPLGGTTGNADFYSWGLTGKRQGIKFFDTRAVGVQSNVTADGKDSVVVFAVNTFTRFSSPNAAEFDILIDVNGDGKPDFDLVGVDLGLLTSGSSSGQMISALFNLNDPKAPTLLEFPADAPTDGSTVLLAVLASDLGITSTNPRFTYTETTTNLLDGSTATLPGVASFNVFTSAISNALFVPVAPNKEAVVPVSINPTEWVQTPALGLMVVVEDNTSGERQASLLPVRH